MGQDALQTNCHNPLLNPMYALPMYMKYARNPTYLLHSYLNSNDGCSCSTGPIITNAVAPSSVAYIAYL